MRKAFFLVLWGLTCVGFLAAGVIFLFPAPKHRTEIATALASATKRFAEQQVRADDPKVNGWQSETFLPSWGRRGAEFVQDSPVGKDISDWVAFTTQGSADVIDHHSMGEEENAEYAQALTVFEPLAPELIERFNKPLFVARQASSPSSNTIATNFMSVRAAAIGLAGLGAVRVAEGKLGEGLEMFAAVIHLGAVFEGHQNLINLMIAIAIQGIGVDAFLGCVDPNSAISEKAWLSFSRRVAASIPPGDQVLTALEGEVLFGQNSYDEMRVSGSPQGFREPLDWLPGMVDRDERVYNNLLGSYLKALRAGQALPVLPSSVSFKDKLIGRASFWDEGGEHDYSRMQNVTEHNRRMVVAVALSAAISGFKIRTGRLPSTLSEASQGPDLPSGALIRRLGLTYVLRGGHATLSIPTSKVSAGYNFAAGLKKFGSRSWFRIEPSAIVLLF